VVINKRDAISRVLIRAAAADWGTADRWRIVRLGSTRR
jgi:hypothetical protein